MIRISATHTKADGSSTTTEYDLNLHPDVMKAVEDALAAHDSPLAAIIGGAFEQSIIGTLMMRRLAEQIQDMALAAACTDPTTAQA